MNVVAAWTIIATAVCCGAAVSNAQGTAPLSSVPPYLAAYVRMHDFSGVALVADRNRTLYAGAFGDADISANRPNTISTRFMIGSISKTFTAAAIELLVKRGRLHFTDRLASYVPEYRHAAEITIRQLLDHSAGVPDYYAVPAWAKDRSKNISLSQIARWLSAYPLDFAPGSKSLYSNSGYSLLALVIERASHKSYHDYLSERIFARLGLRNTGALTSPPPAGLAMGYDPAPTPKSLAAANPIATGWLVGNGSIYSSATDLSRWLQVAAIGKIANFGNLPYPYGWGKEGMDANALLDQDGRIPGYASMISIDASSHVTVVVLSNIQCAAVDIIARDLRAAASGERLNPPPLRPSFQPVSKDLRSYVGSYVIGPSVNLSVTIDKEKVFLANTDGAKYPLDPIGPGRFFFRPLYVYVGFTRGAGGSVTAMDWNQGQFQIPRVK